MNFKHTKGPWFQHDNEFPKPMRVTDAEGNTWETSDTFMCAERHGKKTLIALVKYSTSDAGFATVDDLEEAKANARLIEHADEALTALVEAESFISCYEGDPDQEGVDELLKGIRDIISKIGG